MKLSGLSTSSVQQEKAFLQRIFHGSIECADIDVRHGPAIISHWKFSFGEEIDISLILTPGYPMDACAMVAVHRRACKTNLQRTVELDQNWPLRVCARKECCQELIESQRFLQNLSQYLKGSQSALAILLAAKRHILLDKGTAYVSNDFFEGKTDEVSAARELIPENNPLAYIKCSVDAFNEWRKKFGVENHGSDSGSTVVQDARAGRAGAYTGREYFELNMDAREVDWDLFESHGTMD